MLPLEILLAIRMPAAPSPRLTALERVSRDACEQLDAHQRSAGRSAASAPPASTAAFRNWWRLGLLQFLVATGRYGDFRQQADVFGTPSDDDDAAAEHHVLRGLFAEIQARLSEEASIGAGSRAEAPKARGPFIADALGEARREYARALAFRSAHAESWLRLARVDLETDRGSAARETLTRLATEPCTDVTCGLAWLFPWPVQRQGRGARSCGVGLRPRCAGPLRVARRAARPDESWHAQRRSCRCAGRPPAAATSEPAQDAWALYLSGQRIDGDIVIRRLRTLMKP